MSRRGEKKASVKKGSYQSFVFTSQLRIPLLLGNQDTYHLKLLKFTCSSLGKNDAVNTLM